MAKIMGNIVGLPSPRSDWSQTNETKADYIKNKPTKLSQFENDSKFVKDTEVEGKVKGVGDKLYATKEQVGDISAALDSILAIQASYIGGDSE